MHKNNYNLTRGLPLYLFIIAKLKNNRLVVNKRDFGVIKYVHPPKQSRNILFKRPRNPCIHRIITNPHFDRFDNHRNAAATDPTYFLNLLLFNR